MKKREYIINLLCFFWKRYRVCIACMVLIFIPSACEIKNKSTKFLYETDEFRSGPRRGPIWFSQTWFYVNQSLDDLFSTAGVHTFQINNPYGDFEVQCADGCVHKFTLLNDIFSPILHYSRTISSPGFDDIVQYCLVQYRNGSLYRTMYKNSLQEALQERLHTNLALESVCKLEGLWATPGTTFLFNVSIKGDFSRHSHLGLIKYYLSKEFLLRNIFIYNIHCEVTRSSFFKIVVMHEGKMYMQTSVYLTMEEADNEVKNNQNMLANTIYFAERCH